VTQSGITICVVDDDPSVCKALSRLIKSSGFRVKTYGSTQEFLDDDHTARTDLLILDVHMPGMNGLDLQSHLMASGYTIPIVFITAYVDGALKKKAMAAGAVAFLQKPFSEENLLGAIYKGLNLNNT
jgi:FixJ family two-component response regulator